MSRTQRRIRHVTEAASLRIGPIFAALVRFFPGRVFAVVENVFRRGEGRHPFAVAQHRIPAGVVDRSICRWVQNT
jgi:hypothetical protein